MKDYAITCNELTKYFGQIKIVDHLSLNIPKGCIFGLLGRNGMGKTTTIRMLLGFLSPTAGFSTLLGRKSAELRPEDRARIGYLTEGHELFSWMTIKEINQFQSSFYSLWNQRVFNAVIDHFELTPKMKIKHLSRGQRAGLCLALTLSPEPELLILDDPALGLDPVARRSLIELMIYLTRKSDRTILFSSHILSDVERIADQIGILDEGVLRAHCDIETFRERVRRYRLKFKTPPEQLKKHSIPGLLECFKTENEWLITLANPDEQSLTAINLLNAESCENIEISMEDAFISYISHRGERSLRFDEVIKGNEQ